MLRALWLRAPSVYIVHACAVLQVSSLVRVLPLTSLLHLHSTCSAYLYIAQLDSGAKGHDGRVMYLCFAVLVVDRALSQGRAGGEDVPQRFKDLWEAMPTSTKPLKDALLSSAEDLVLRDANGEKVEAFFDASRLAFFDLQKNAEAESGGGKDGSESGKY